MAQTEKMLSCYFTDSHVISGNRRALNSFELTIDEHNSGSFAGYAPVEFCIGWRRRRGKYQPISARQQRFNFRFFVGDVLIGAANQVLIAERFGDGFHPATNLG